MYSIASEENIFINDNNRLSIVRKDTYLIM